MWVVCSSCDQDRWYDQADELWTCPTCGESYDEAELFDLDTTEEASNG
jgi:ribosomal protein L37AE/L43A